jgi:S-adenosylhomocysteine hydrolase
LPPIRNIGTAKVAAVPREAPAAQAHTLGLADLLERIPTEQGTVLADQLYARVAPHLKGEGQLESFTPLKNGPSDKLGQQLVKSWQQQFIMSWQTRQALPAALADVLWPFSNEGKAVDIAAAERALGPELGDFLRKLSRIDAHVASRADADRLVYDWMSDHQLGRVLGAAPTVAPKLPALDFTLQRFGKPHELDGFKFLGLQHLFASSAKMFEAIGSLGVAPKDSHFIGKIYSTNMRVAAELELKGAEVAPVSKRITNGRAFGPAMEESIVHQLGKLIDQLPQPRREYGPDGEKLIWDPPPKPQVLLIDDGAEAIKTLHEKYPQWAPFFACVEQTRRGARIAHDLADKGQLKCAVVNVAESWAKLERESPMIGESVVREVERKLDRIERAGVPRAKEAVVIGYGAIGQGVAKALKARGVEVHVYDSDASRLKDLPPGMVGHTDKGEALTHGQVAISCVGTRTLFSDDYEKFPSGAVLVNAASADDELGPEELLQYRKMNEVVDEKGEAWGVFHGQALDLGKSDDTAHSDTVVKLNSGKELLVASNGFVVNMTGERDPIPPPFIQLTRSLLLMGAMTAVRSDKPGLIDVPEQWQKELVAFIERQLAEQGRTLQKPLWDAVVDAPPPPPPKAILENVEIETQGRPEPPRPQPSAEALANAERVGVTNPSPPPPGALRGKYALGEAWDRQSFAYAVASAMEVPKHDMTVEAWALYHATFNANAANGWHLNVKFKPAEPGRATAEQLAGLNATQDQQFDAFFGYHLAGVTFAALQTRLKRPPTDAELAAAMVKTARQAKVDLGLYVGWLKKQGADEASLAKALEAAT